jgi:hypothetical protein
VRTSSNNNHVKRFESYEIGYKKEEGVYFFRDKLYSGSILSLLNTGWRAHISVAPSKVMDAYLLIAGILDKYKVIYFEMLDEDFFEKKQKEMSQYFINKPKEQNSSELITNNKNEFNETQAKEYLNKIEKNMQGMQFTIYMLPGTESKIQEMLGEINEKLNQSEIPCGKISENTHCLSDYISVRYVERKLAYYTTSLTLYEPIEVKNPFKKIESSMSKEIKSPISGSRRN